MKVPAIDQADIDALAATLPRLSFGDAERRNVLLEGGTRDINAAPGSGKTTILAAKLLMLARKWPEDRAGICVISHTNVARDQIQHRLASNADGSRLLSYPHFIGTIHAFVNQFLALPFVRSSGLEVDVIDNDAFEKKALIMARRNGVLRTWMDNNEGVADLIATLVFRGAALELASEKGALPSPNSKSYPLLEGIKSELKSQGIFRYADMFAFAECLLSDFPHVKRLISKRFPLVFIDEMQDTSWPQEDLLGRVFDETVTVQRFGDVNQRILGSEAGAEKLTFPQPNCLSISSSKRFGPAIAKAVSAVQLSGTPVVGDQPDFCAPAVILYDEARITDVIPYFGRLALETFSDEQLRVGAVRALCARKQGGANAPPGRHLSDFWPAFAQQVQGSMARTDRLWTLLADGQTGNAGTGTLSGRATDVRRAFLLVLRSAASTQVADVRDGPYLIRTLDKNGISTESLRRLCRDVVFARGLSETTQARAQVPAMLFSPLSSLLPEGMTLETFAALSVFAEPEVSPTEEESSRSCTVEDKGRLVEIRLGTVASMKGETHLASLVLESHGGQSRRFDLKSLS
jgi:DNA helicase-2/ATP-dependent DNA helicase PcrA